ncbi:MAG: DEAD/DEAH box helicase [Pseudomonadota bacterium]
MSSIELNEQFLQTLELMELGQQNLFITGKAGTGKSTLLNHFKTVTQKKIAVLAPTGAAAVNIKGQTIHSFFGFKPDVTPESVKVTKKKNIYKSLDAIIIDEISMVRADLLDCIDKFLRFNGKDPSRAFGGIQMIFIGDLYQLPPVVQSSERQIFQSHYHSPYFFSAHCFEEIEIKYIELKTIYRQSDPKFISLLNSIRNNTTSDQEIALLNERYNESFNSTPQDFCIYLTTTNANAELINSQRLQQVTETEFTFQGAIEGDFAKNQLPTAADLKLKIGAQVMMLSNDFMGRYINGTIGKILDIERGDEDPKLVILLESGKRVKVSPYTWELYNFYLEGVELKSKVVGSFTQYPVTLAWAITIHKSQGKTFDKVVLDIGYGTFAHGQIYVALSRCRTLEGLVLTKKILKKHILMDSAVSKFSLRYSDIS